MKRILAIILAAAGIILLFAECDNFLAACAMKLASVALITGGMALLDPDKEISERV